MTWIWKQGSWTLITMYLYGYKPTLEIFVTWDVFQGDPSLGKLTLSSHSTVRDIKKTTQQGHRLCFEVFSFWVNLHYVRYAFQAIHINATASGWRYRINHREEQL